MHQLVNELLAIDKALTVPYRNNVLISKYHIGPWNVD